MPRVVVLMFAALLGLSPISFGGGSAAAQELEACEPGKVPEGLGLDPETDSYFWDGVCRPIPPESEGPAPIGVDLIMQPNAVYFAEDFAAVPDGRSGQFTPEFMVVIVKDGIFALEVKPETPSTIVVYGAGNEIPTLTDLVDQEPYYSPTDDVLTDIQGNPCLHACIVPPGIVVQLGPGDQVVAEVGALCVYCLIGETAARDGETGILEVFVLREVGADFETFSWIQSWDRAQEGLLSATTESRTMIGWAFAPKGRCHGG